MSPVRKLVFLFATAPLLTGVGASAAAAQSAAVVDPSQAYRTYIDQCHAAHVCNGVYLVAREGLPVFLGAVGDNGDERRSPLTMDSRFEIASISKEFTAVAVLKLAEEGRLSIDDKVADHLPGFPYGAMTIREMLSHTSGVPDAMEVYSDRLRAGEAGGPVTGTDVVEVLAGSGLQPEFEPGARFEYSNTGYLILAAIVETVSGRPFADYLEETIFRPLGMMQTQVRTPANEAEITDRVLGFRPAFDGGRRPYDQFPGVYLRGVGGIYSTAPDLLLWQDALVAGRILSPDSWRAATTATVLSDGRKAPYGLGFTLKPDGRGVERISHGGDWRAFRSDLSYYPATGITVIQLTNTGEDDSVDANVGALALIAEGGTPDPVAGPIEWDLSPRLGDAAAARAWFEGELQAQPRRYVFQEETLNQFGYALIEQKKADQAVLVFQLAILAFPQSANLRDSLADAYVAQGNTPAAIESIRAALALDPSSEAFQRRLETLSAGQGRSAE